MEPDMQPQNMQQPPEAESAPEADDQGGTSIELMIKADGSMSVSMEAGDVEGREDQEVPAKNLDDAMRIIRQMASQLLNGATSPSAQQEQQAYEQEMAG